MQGYNLIAVFHKDTDKWLMCRRKKDPYKGLSNLVGGKIEAGEDGMDAAYRELEEETAIRRDDIHLTHLMDFSYPLDDCYVEVYVGRLKREVEVSGDENTLYWSDLEQNFFDSSKYAGEGNIGHIWEHIELKWQFLLQLPEAMERWDLQECRTIFENKRKAVYEAVSLKYGPVILKINWDVKQLGEEVLLLQALDGDGCCRLYDYDRESGFLLEERIMPGKVLREVADLDKRINAFAHVFRHIHIYHPEEGQAPDYRQWLDGICEFCVQKNVNREITRKVYEAREICGEMFEKYPERVLLHGDLHHDNLLLREDGTYGIIDPKSVVGPEILDVARFLKNEIDTQYDIPVKEHMYRAALAISEALDYPLEDVIKVYFMEVILGNVWCLEDGDAMSEEEIAVAYELYQNDCH